MAQQNAPPPPSDAVQRPTRGRRLIAAVFFAAQVSLAALLLLAGYHVAHAPAVLWAIVSAVLVLQPGLKASLRVSIDRISANLLGAGVGLTVGLLPGDSAWHLILALVLVVFIGSWLRLEQSLRTACVAAAIVMLADPANVAASGVERFSSVLIGCVLGLGVEYATGWARKPLGLNTAQENQSPS